MSKYLYFLLFFLPIGALAQTDFCGSSILQLEEENQKAAREFYQKDRHLSLLRSNTLDSVAITIHLVKPPGANDIGLSYAEIEREIAGANRVFGSSGIFFYICGSPRIIEGAAAYNYSVAEQLNRANYIPKTINIYFVDEIFVSEERFLCGFAFFPFAGDPNQRFIFMDKDCSTDGSTLIHELGHFYGLFHTHEIAFGQEFVNGSNCDTAGDLICDTAADPNLSRPGLLNNCTYVGNIIDSQGDFYAPPVRNFMSYAPSFCTGEFSIEQRALMRAVHENENSYLTGRCDFYPDFMVNSNLKNKTINSISAIDAEYILEFIAVEATTNVGFRVMLFDDPEQTTGIILYEEELTLSPGNEIINLDLQLEIPPSKVSGTYYLVAQIDPGQRVIERTEQNNNYRIEVQIDNSQFPGLTLFPNPVQKETFLFYRDQRMRGFYTVRVFRYDGVEVLRDQGFKNSDEILRSLDLSDLNPGIYIAYLSFDKINFSHSFKFVKR